MNSPTTANADFPNYANLDQTIYHREQWDGPTSGTGTTKGMALDKFISKYCTVQSDYPGCGEILGKGKPLLGCSCDTDPAHCPGVKVTKTRKDKTKYQTTEHRKHAVIPFDLKTNLVLDIDLKSVGGRVVSSVETERNEQGKDMQFRLLTHLDQILKKFCSNGGNKDFKMDKINLDHLGYAVHTSHGIKHQGSKKPVAVLSYHIVVNALCMLWETPRCASVALDQSARPRSVWCMLKVAIALAIVTRNM